MPFIVLLEHAVFIILIRQENNFNFISGLPDGLNPLTEDTLFKQVKKKRKV